MLPKAYLPSYCICSELQIMKVQCKIAYIYMQRIKNKSKDEIINQIKFYLKKHCFVTQLF